MTNIVSVDRWGNEQAIKKSLPNLDPNFLMFGNGVGRGISVEDITEKPYQYHPWIYASAKVISNNLMWLDKCLVTKKDPDTMQFEHKVLEVFEMPNPWMNTPQFWQAVILGLLLPSKRSYKARTTTDEPIPVNKTDSQEDVGGQVFLIPLTLKGKKVNLRRGEIPDAMLPLYDRNVVAKESVMPNGATKITEWWWINTANNKIVESFKPEEIIRINLFNPYDWVRGLSPYSAAGLTMVDDIKSDIYNTQAFDNDGTVAGLLTTDQVLTQDQININLNKWNQRHGGVSNNGKIAMLTGGLTYDQFGLSHADMQFMDQKKFNFEKIAAAYGLNKIAYGKYEDINFATIKEGRKMLWQDTYQPIDKLITNSITTQWTRYVEKGWVLKSDYSKVEALRQDYTKPISASKTLFDMGMPAAQALRINGVPVTDQMIKEYPWLNEEPKQKVNPQQEEEPKKSIAKTVNKKDVSKSKMTDEERKAQSWDYIHKVLDPGEKKWKETMTRLFNSQRNRMQDKVDKWLSNIVPAPKKVDRDIYYKAFWKGFINEYGKLNYGMYQIKGTDYISNPFLNKKDALRMKNQPSYHDWDNLKALEVFDKTKLKVIKEVIISPGSFLLDPFEENEKLLELVEPLIEDQMKREKTRLQDELGSLIEWDVTDENIQEYIDARKEQITEINTTTFKKANKKIGEAIETSVKNNETPQEAAKRIKAAISDVGEVRKNQSATIARTETGIISSTSRYQAFRVEGIEYHEWLNAADENIRIDHTQKPYGVGGEVVRVGATFPIVLMKFPLDPSGAANQIINCRCVAIAAEAPKT